ncbi:zinc carboxypeptidase family protein (macronuclear) [Tetrahymena thermophila SB210]|uniref:Zinc carboxypeptidase family protein n=1 Tax=Tetrahymena thermophila (strain SB210) TaxID=312017 RepID=Q228D2_TETTS|nr:zinc carboxypeptidase family protein [Tetrahymena thermophila SB210]EAR81647.1 zinc carboxypeptidase family protein [Tetrahymena thermophila SB210]|eukprot:XP_001029310.1 zinc carboxypeptidase family protein [Tetrahymena thermophila SB210]
MDNLQLNELSNQSCIFHPDKKITFIQVIGVSNQPNANIFLCDQCFDQDLDLKGVNYMTISQIIEKAEKEFQFKWPPLKDQSLIQMLHLKSQNIISADKILQQINSFFANFKDEIIKKIDFNRKKMINYVLDPPFNKEQIMKQYQQISQILSLKNLLLENQKESFDKHQQKCKDFIYQFETQKESNTKQIEELLKQCDQVGQIIDFDYLNTLKQQVLDFVDEIKLNSNKDILGLQKPIQSQISDNQQSINNNNNNNAEKLMQLISNKSNYCSEEFLESARKELTKLNQQLSRIQFDNIFKENRQPIKFSQINDEQLQNINGYVENFIKLGNDQSYLQQIQQSVNLNKVVEDSRLSKPKQKNRSYKVA